MDTAGAGKLVTNLVQLVPSKEHFKIMGGLLTPPPTATKRRLKDIGRLRMHSIDFKIALEKRLRKKDSLLNLISLSIPSWTCFTFSQVQGNLTPPVSNPSSLLLIRKTMFFVIQNIKFRCLYTPLLCNVRVQCNGESHYVEYNAWIILWMAPFWVVKKITS